MGGPCAHHLPVYCASFMQVVQEDNIWFRARHLPTIWILIPQEEKDLLNARSKSKSRPDRSGLESIHPVRLPDPPPLHSSVEVSQAMNDAMLAGVSTTPRYHKDGNLEEGHGGLSKHADHYTETFQRAC